MKLNKKYIIFLLSFLFLLNIVNSSQAFSDNENENDEKIVEVNYATYLDIDSDGFEDDIITKFILRSPTSLLSYITADVYLYLVLPSGNMFVMEFTYSQIYTETTLIVEWMNCATESGWYEIVIILDYSGFDIMGNTFSGVIWDSLEFDPPTKSGPGSPFGTIYFL